MQAECKKSCIMQANTSKAHLRKVQSRVLAIKLKYSGTSIIQTPKDQQLLIVLIKEVSLIQWLRNLQTSKISVWIIEVSVIQGVN